MALTQHVVHVYAPIDRVALASFPTAAITSPSVDDVIIILATLLLFATGVRQWREHSVALVITGNGRQVPFRSDVTWSYCDPPAFQTGPSACDS